MNTSQTWEFEEQLRKSLGSPAKADFDHWRSRHGDAVAYLNPVVTEINRRRRNMILRIVGAAAAAVVFLSFASMLFPQRSSFAQAIKAIERATSISWTTTFYQRVYSVDGKRTWLRAERMDMAYRSPNLYRDTRYDEDGNVRSVEIIDILNNKTLLLDMKAKKAIWLVQPTNQYAPDGPFASVSKVLKQEPVELVGQSMVNGAPVNIFRFRREGKEMSDDRRTVDIWLDAKTKKLVRVCDPGADSFDPDTAPDRNNPAEKKFSKGQLMGSMQRGIVLDADLKPESFSLTPPNGFEIVVQPPRPTVTEADLIEWLGATARFNGGSFADTYRGIDLKRYNEAATKKKADRTDVERKLVDLQYKHMLNRNGVVMASFANEYTVGGHFRYLGKGVKLGSSDRIVMFYKLKSTGKYRAIYGDLTVKDVNPNDLPLPIED